MKKLFCIIWLIFITVPNCSIGANSTDVVIGCTEEDEARIASVKALIVPNSSGRLALPTQDGRPKFYYECQHDECLTEHGYRLFADPLDHNAQVTELLLDGHTLCRARDVKRIACGTCYTLMEFADSLIIVEDTVQSVCINQSCQAVLGDMGGCAVCKLVQDSSFPTFHCDKCKICRAGRQEQYKHCDTCGLCIDQTLGVHQCKAHAKGSCAICLDGFSAAHSRLLQSTCGHWLHESCMTEYGKTNFSCPTCRKTMFSVDWDVAFNGILQLVLPDDLRFYRIEAQCNDCEKRQEVRWHPYGLRCVQQECGSMNMAAIGNKKHVAVDQWPEFAIVHELLSRSEQQATTDDDVD